MTKSMNANSMALSPSSVYITLLQLYFGLVRNSDSVPQRRTGFPALTVLASRRNCCRTEVGFAAGSVEPKEPIRKSLRIIIHDMNLSP